MKFLEGMRERFLGTRFVYDPHLQESGQRRPDGTVAIGPEGIKSAIESAKAFGKDSPTARGLTLAYVEKHFPEALTDLEKAEKQD